MNDIEKIKRLIEIKNRRKDYLEYLKKTKR